MPYITEEIWQHLSDKVSYPSIIDQVSIMKASYPGVRPEWLDEEVENRFGLLKDVIVALRTIRSENNVPPDKTGTALIIPANPADEAWLSSQSGLINLFVRLSRTTVDPHAAKPKFAGQAVVRGNNIFLELEGLIDRTVEIERLTKEIDHQAKIAESARQRLSNESFVSRAPAAVVDKEKEKLQSILHNLEKLEKSLAALKG
jgi:valyl-tRNA synthetase